MRDALPPIHGATAMFPALPVTQAVANIVAGVDEPLYGRAGAVHIQLCPQSFGHLSEAACEAMAAKYPDTRFRLHANARVLSRLHLLDASTFNDDTRPYYAALADRSRRLGATVYSLHAGYADNATLAAMLDNVRRLQDLFGPDCTVAVEGLYPRRDRAQLMASWLEYETVLRAGVPMAIDLSHVHIVARHERSTGGDLLRALVSHPQTRELHVSANDGVHDNHRPLEREPWWWSELGHAGPNAIVFSESNQARPSRSTTQPIQ